MVVLTSQEVKLGWSNDLLCEEVGHHLDAVVAAVDVVTCGQCYYSFYGRK
jgi:hypothetical protein